MVVKKRRRKTIRKQKRRRKTKKQKRRRRRRRTKETYERQVHPSKEFIKALKTHDSGLIMICH